MSWENVFDNPTISYIMFLLSFLWLDRIHTSLEPVVDRQIICFSLSGYPQGLFRLTNHRCWSVSFKWEAPKQWDVIHEGQSEVRRSLFSRFVTIIRDWKTQHEPSFKFACLVLRVLWPKQPIKISSFLEDVIYIFDHCEGLKAFDSLMWLFPYRCRLGGMIPLWPQGWVHATSP